MLAALLVAPLASAFSTHVQAVRPVALARPHRAATPCLPTSVHTRLQTRGRNAVSMTAMTAIGRSRALTALVACRLPLAVMATLAVFAAVAARFGCRRPSNDLQMPVRASVPIPSTASVATTSPEQLSEAAGGARPEASTPDGGSDADVPLDPLGLRDLDPRSRLLLVPCCALSLEPAGELGLARMCVRALPATIDVPQLERIFAQVRPPVGQVATRLVGRSCKPGCPSAFSLQPSAAQVHLLLAAQVRRVMDRGEHFTVFWDLRQLRPPSRAALKFGVGWMGRPENGADFDEYIDAIVLLVTSPVVRFVAEWSLKACNPPNPVHVVSNEAEAIEAARAYT